jgi:hypothetical protein
MDVIDLHLLVVRIHSRSVTSTGVIFKERKNPGRRIDKRNCEGDKLAKEQLPPVIETGTLGCLAIAAIPRSTTELKKLVDDNRSHTPFI